MISSERFLHHPLEGSCRRGWNVPGLGRLWQVRREERVGRGDRAEINMRDFRSQRGIHPIDEDIGQQRIAGVRRMDAIEREKAAEKGEARFIAVDRRRILPICVNAVLYPPACRSRLRPVAMMVALYCWIVCCTVATSAGLKKPPSPDRPALFPGQDRLISVFRWD